MYKRKNINVLVFGLVVYSLSISGVRQRPTVNICISSVGWREESLRKVIASIINQADKVFVFLQQYKEVPKFLYNDKIVFIRGENEPEALALGSSAKFFWADKIRGYYITMDDDIVYPGDYVNYCISNIEAYGRKAVVGFHGTIFKNQITDYKHDILRFWYKKGLKRDTSVHMLGTGVMAYHTDTISVSMRNFRTKNQDDVWFALAAQHQGVPMICLKRNDNYIDAIGLSAKDDRSISAPDADHQIKLASQFAPWIIYAVRR